ncbi:MAG: 3-dehydroquinate synthase II, partial [Candidatus Bathyarchaeia archaeon]
MKELWVEVAEGLPTDLKKGLISAASEVADTILVSLRDRPLTEGSGRLVAGDFEGANIRTVPFQKASDISMVRPRTKDLAARVIIKDGKDEAKALEAVNLGSRYVIIECTDWKTIPLENIIARLRGKAKILMQVSTLDEAKLAIETLQLGADGVVYRASSPEEVHAAGKIVKKASLRLQLTEAEVTQVRPLGTGARVCVDTCDLMKPREGLLVGSQSSGLILVESETMENPHVEPRPFRVNAGAVASYLLTSPERTRYLSELKAGDEVMIVDSEGNTRMTNVCRVKIEWRPMVIVEARTGGRNINVILQNAETVRLVTREGSRSVSEMKPGERVLAR